MSIVRKPGEYQSSCFQIRNSHEVTVPLLRQRLNRFRYMLVTRSDDGNFGRNPETWLNKSSFKLDEVYKRKESGD